MAKSNKDKRGSDKHKSSSKGDKHDAKGDKKGRVSQSDGQRSSFSKYVRKGASKSAKTNDNDQGDPKSLKGTKRGGHDGGPKNKES
jgi:hypothetical protein